MYKDSGQLRIEDFVFPYGKLDPENDWGKLAVLVPWKTAEEGYAAQFVDNGHPAHPCRMALGVLLIQQWLKCSNVWLVRHIGEKPYLQYFIGMKEYGRALLGHLRWWRSGNAPAKRTWRQFWRHLSPGRRKAGTMRITTILPTAAHWCWMPPAVPRTSPITRM